MACGTKAAESSFSTVETSSSHSQPSDETSFDLFGYRIGVPNSAKGYILIRNEFESLATDAADTIAANYHSRYKNLEGIMKYADEDAFNLIVEGIEHAVEFLNKMGIYNINFDSFAEEAKELIGSWGCAFGELEDIYNKLNDYKQEQKDYRSMRKGGRGRLVGGGFGVGGAVKGMAMAGTVNATTGMLHSLANAVGNAATSAEVGNKMSRIYNDPATKEALCYGIYEDVFYLHYVLIDFINKNGSQNIPILYSENDYKESKIIYDNILNGNVNNDKLESAVLDMLEKYPLDKRFYKLALDLFGDEDNGLESYAGFFDIEISSIKEAKRREEENEKRLSEILGESARLLDDELCGNNMYHLIKQGMTGDTYKDISEAYSRISNEYTRGKLLLLGGEVDNKVAVKLKNAKDSYAGTKNQQPVALFDNTAFGSAKDGFLITDSCVYVHNMMEKAWSIDINNIESIELNGSEIRLNGQSLNISLIDGKARQEFFEFIQLAVLLIKYCGKISVQNQSKNEPVAPVDVNGTGTAAPKKEKVSGDVTDTIRNIVLSIQNPKIKDYLLVYNESAKANEKIKSALESYAKPSVGEVVHVCFDNTAFGGAKDGFILTNKYIYAHNMWAKTMKIDLQSIHSITVSGSDLKIGNDVIYINMIEKNSREEFRDIVEELVNILK